MSGVVAYIEGALARDRLMRLAVDYEEFGSIDVAQVVSYFHKIAQSMSEKM